ncbi:hypothetical protein [Paraliomyxa miuraensis]|uniref:hypothetical protein n=1 Tax=Paraliomyxa miuraensis TaxID=376150 RepID=UPI00224F09C8|nr:hypothetical protein [Paraliomyxa miuraensis]MCX4246515.1 hypothetical protein [Paraliomyxa miuraensis]
MHIINDVRVDVWKQRRADRPSRVHRCRRRRRTQGTDALVGQCLDASIEREPALLGLRHVAAHRLGIDTELGGDPLLGDPGKPLPEHFLDLDHRDLRYTMGPLSSG